MERVLPELREQGKNEEASAIERELTLLRNAVADFEAAAPARKTAVLPSLASPEPTNNRFMRRQGLGDEVGAPSPEEAKKARRRPSSRRGAAARREAQKGD
jgi:hypothetical protein